LDLTRDEFERLALEQLDTLYRIARRLARDHDRAEDLVQETYLRAVRSRQSFTLQEFGIRPWLLRIMHNVHYSRSERERRQPAAVDAEQLEAITQSARAPVAVSPLTVDPFSFDGMDEKLVRALEQLPPEYQVVLLLWAIDGLSYKEIAHSVDVPLGTVMSRLHRARHRLAEQLREHAIREGIIRE
jgi:RNA polymerase sigma-70 factor (ECF subfamily)